MIAIAVGRMVVQIVVVMTEAIAGLAVVGAALCHHQLPHQVLYLQV